ncbi:MAG: 5-deoxy-glucuronate isomerase [Actinomycetota bacterium]|nr:5-deoxy-glucuronate isomerase [Actinomycetota bacterium]
MLTVALTPGVPTPELLTGDREYLVVPLHGSVDVEITEGSSPARLVRLAGRESVFDGPTDVVYLPPACSLRLSSLQPSRVALPFAVAATRESAAAVQHIPRGDVPVELRGAGQASREVRNFGVPGVLDADSIIACEVVTPAGNWSSYPPHKHDEERPGVETELEEIYYFEVATESSPAAGAAGPGAADPVAYHRVYGTTERPIDVLTEVRTGDVVLVPHGWHGPSMAPPGYDLYYLNVMAGPGPERAWLICDDPAHGWVRDTWAGQEVDPRLPTTSPASKRDSS